MDKTKLSSLFIFHFGVLIKIYKPPTKNVVLLARSSGRKGNKFDRSFAGKRNNFDCRLLRVDPSLVLSELGHSKSQENNTR